ncbi:MAG: hypothetical protein WDN06_19505 [Asticcacaulis sp.]
MAARPYPPRSDDADHVGPGHPDRHLFVSRWVSDAARKVVRRVVQNDADRTLPEIPVAGGAPG